ncbi:MAG: DUF805 domain-containing protein [Porphyrobacter sp.]|nr:DUF805 domain-containing protein [Porphyrobacter sp.]
MEWMIMPFRRYADFSGRSRRKEYWMFQLFNFLVGLVLAGPFFISYFGAISAASGNPEQEAAAVEAIAAGGFGLSFIGLALYGLYLLAAFIPSIAVTVRRFHDRDMSGWWYPGLIVASLIPLIGFVASIALIVFMVLPGSSGANRFGPDPKDPYAEDVFA